MATRGISAGLQIFPQTPNFKSFEDLPPYLNNVGNWVKSAVDLLSAQAKTIPYASYLDMPPLAGLPRFVNVPDDPTYGQVICFNGVSTSGTDTGWYRLIPAGTAGGPSITIPAGGTTSQVLGKKTGTDYDFQWETPPFLNSTAGTTGQVLTKNGTSSLNYQTTWVDPHYVPAGGTAAQALRKTSTADYAASWADVHEVPAGGTTGQVLTKTSASDYALSWADTARPAFVGAVIYSTSTTTLISAVDARMSWTSTVYDGASFYAGGNPTRLTIGAGISFAELRANIAFTDNALGVPGTRHAEFWKNGSAMTTAVGQVSHYAVGTGDVSVLNLSSPVLSVGSGDYFELNVGQSSGTSATVSPAGATWFSIAVRQ